MAFNYLFILSVQCSGALFFSLLDLLDSNIISNQILLCFVYFQCLIFALLYDKERLFLIFLGMTFLFNLVMPISEALGLFSFPPGNLILLGDGVTLSITEASLAEAYGTMIVMLFGVTAGWSGAKVINKSFVNNSFKNQNQIKDFGQIKFFINVLFIVFFAILIYRNILLVYYSSIYGYVDVMHKQKTDLGLPFVTMIADMFYKLVAFLLLYFTRQRRQFIVVCALFALPFFIQAIAGGRGEFVLVVITLLIIYQINFKSLSMIKLLRWATLLFVGGAIIGSFRFSRNFNSLFELEQFLRLLLTVFLGNSSSLGVLAYTIQLKDQFFNNVPFLLGYIQATFSFAPNYTYEGLLHKSYLAQHVTYLLNPDKLFGGSTIGTSVVAEFYEFSRGSFSIQFLLSFLMLYFGQVLIMNIRKSFFIFFFGALYFEAMIFAPRGSIMKIFSKESIASYAIIIFIYACFKLVGQSKSNDKANFKIIKYKNQH